MKKLTYKELSKKANVSKSVLSRFFNNGYVSEEKKQKIRKIVKETGYIQNRSAASIRSKEKKGTIIIRTFILSKTQDHIINGILTTAQGEEAIVKYSISDEKNIIENVLWALTINVKNLIIFAPVDAGKNFYKVIKKALLHSKITIYNFNYPDVTSIVPSYEKVFKNLSVKIKEIDFIYNDKNDVESYENKMKTLQNYFYKVNIIYYKNVKNSQHFKFFQTDNLRVFLQSKINLDKNIIISYENPLFFKKDDIWIFLDHFQMGIFLWKYLDKKEHKKIKIEAKEINFIKNKLPNTFYKI